MLGAIIFQLGMHAGHSDPFSAPVGCCVSSSLSRLINCQTPSHWQVIHGELQKFLLLNTSLALPTHPRAAAAATQNFPSRSVCSAESHILLPHNGGNRKKIALNFRVSQYNYDLLYEKYFSSELFTPNSQSLLSSNNFLCVSNFATLGFLTNIALSFMVRRDKEFLLLLAGRKVFTSESQLHWSAPRVLLRECSIVRKDVPLRNLILITLTQAV